MIINEEHLEKELLKSLPDETAIDYNQMTHTITLSLNLRVREHITEELINSKYIRQIPEQWYLKLHEALISSEVKWRKKLGE